MDRTNLKLKHRTWFVRLVVPPNLRGVIGKRELHRTLHTHDLREANRRKHEILADLHRELRAAELHADLPADAADYILKVADGQRRAVREGLMDEQTAQAGLDAAIETQIELLRRKRGADPETGEPHGSEQHLRMYDIAQRIFDGDEVELLSRASRQYLDEIAQRIRKQSLRERERHIDALRDWLKVDVEVSAITKKIAGKYTTEYLRRQGHMPKTTKDILSNLSAFWRWMEGRGLVEENVWSGMAGTVRESTRGTAPRRRPWTDAELLKLCKALPTNDPLLPFTVIAIYTGMRREEIALLRVEDVADDALTIREGKTTAALRRVPIHSALRPMIDRLIETSIDGYLIPGLLTGGADAKRSHYLGKRFGKFIRSIGFDDPALVFHTLRNAFIQRCEEGGVPESSAKLMVGHSRRSSLTYGSIGAGYSPGVQLETLRKEIEKVTFGDLDPFVKQLAASVKVTRKSARRPRAVYNRRQRISKEPTP